MGVPDEVEHSRIGIESHCGGWSAVWIGRAKKKEMMMIETEGHPTPRGNCD